MECDIANITFNDFKIPSLKKLRLFIINSVENSYTSLPEVIFHGKDAEDYFISELKNEFSINGVKILEKAKIEIEINTNNVFRAICSFSNVKIEWNNYFGPASYEQKQK